MTLEEFQVFASETIHALDPAAVVTFENDCGVVDENDKRMRHFWAANIDLNGRRITVACEADLGQIDFRDSFRFHAERSVERLLV